MTDYAGLRGVVGSQGTVGGERGRRNRLLARGGLRWRRRVVEALGMRTIGYDEVPHGRGRQLGALAEPLQQCGGRVPVLFQDALHAGELVLVDAGRGLLEQGADATPGLIGYMLNSHTIAKASIMAYFGR